MKKIYIFLVLAPLIGLIFSCSTEESGTQPSSNQFPIDNGNNGGNSNVIIPSFGINWTPNHDDIYRDYPIERSSENLLIGRWKPFKMGVDENNDGNVKYYNYSDYRHLECGNSFLQFNNDGVIIENDYYNDNIKCSLYSLQATWNLFGDDSNRLRIDNVDFYHIISVNERELVIKIDWNFENSLYGPSQVYYYYERIQAPD